MLSGSLRSRVATLTVADIVGVSIESLTACNLMRFPLPSEVAGAVDPVDPVGVSDASRFLSSVVVPLMVAMFCVLVWESSDSRISPRGTGS